MKAQELNRAIAKKRKRTTQSKDKHANPMRCSSLKWSVFLSHTKENWVLACYEQQAKLKKPKN